MFLKGYQLLDVLVLRSYLGHLVDAADYLHMASHFMGDAVIVSLFQFLG